MWSSCLSGFSAVLRAAISGRWGHCVTLRQVGLPCFPPLKPSCLQGVGFTRPNLGEGSFDLLQKKWMQLEEFLLACKKSRKTWETFGSMMKSMTRSHLSHPRDLRLSLDSGLSYSKACWTKPHANFRQDLQNQSIASINAMAREQVPKWNA